MRITFALLFALLIADLHAQYQVYVGGNLSILPTVSKTTQSQTSVPSTYKLQESYESRIGYEAGIIRSWQFGKKLMLSFGAGFSSIAYKRSIDLEDLSPTSSVGDLLGWSFNTDNIYMSGGSSPIISFSDRYGETSINHVVFPLTVHFEVFHNFSVGVGLRGAYLVRSKVVDNEVSFANTVFNMSEADTNNDGTVSVLEMNAYYQSSYEIVEVDDTSQSGFEFFNLLGSVNLSYRIGQHIGITSTIHQGLNPIYDGEKSSTGKDRLRTISFGLTYSL